MGKRMTLLLSIPIPPLGTAQTNSPPNTARANLSIHPLISSRAKSERIYRHPKLGILNGGKWWLQRNHSRTPTDILASTPLPFTMPCFLTLRTRLPFCLSPVRVSQILHLATSAVDYVTLSRCSIGWGRRYCDRNADPMSRQRRCFVNGGDGVRVEDSIESLESKDDFGMALPGTTDEGVPLRSRNWMYSSMCEQ
jgi:hypothetical protein